MPTKTLAAEYLRLALELRLLALNAPRTRGILGHASQCVTIDVKLANDAAAALEVLANMR